MKLVVKSPWMCASATAKVGRSGTTDWILHIEGISLPFPSSNSQLLSKEESSLIKLATNNFMFRFNWPEQSSVSKMFSNVYLSTDGNSTRWLINGQMLNFRDLINGVRSQLTTTENTLFPRTQGSCRALWYISSSSISLMESASVKGRVKVLILQG